MHAPYPAYCRGATPTDGIQLLSGITPRRGTPEKVSELASFLAVRYSIAGASV
jgi:hypothetical protein